jgi:uncharacterized protein DUF6978
VLQQAEADGLLALEKHRTDDTVHRYPDPGGELAIPLLSPDRREEFILDIRRHRIVLVHGGKYQTRARETVPLARLCFARPHRNPDGAEIPRTHLHVYREGFDLQWAFPLDAAIFGDGSDRIRLLNDFLRHCNVTREPIFQYVLV